MIFQYKNFDEIKILFLVNGAFNKAKTLIIPDKNGLLFLPPYSPELNPAENNCAFFKRVSLQTNSIKPYKLFKNDLA